MIRYVNSGYAGIFKPPYSLENHYNHKSTIYCITNRFNSLLIMIPFSSSFYKDAITIAKKSTARIIYLIAPDIGISFASDYYLTWDAINHGLRKVCRIFSKYMIENHTPSAFKDNIIRKKNDTIIFDSLRSETDVGSISITLTKQYVDSSATFACDVILSDSIKKILFVGEMNDIKADYLNKNWKEYEEIHMPFINGIYGGISYHAVLKKYPHLVSKIRCNQFSSYEELAYAKSLNINIGGEYINDPI